MYRTEGDACAGRQEAHHLISRSSLSTRHDPRNGICLCSLHHRFSIQRGAHGSAVGFSEFLRRVFPVLHDWVGTHKWNIQYAKPDYASRCNLLSTMIEIVRKNPDKMKEIREGLYCKQG